MVRFCFNASKHRVACLPVAQCHLLASAGNELHMVYDVCAGGELNNAFQVSSSLTLRRMELTKGNPRRYNPLQNLLSLTGGHQCCHIALQLLSISLPQKEIDALLSEVDNSGTGELEMDDFTQLMVLTLQRKAAHASDHRAQDRKQAKKQDMQQASLPFEVVALAYRRCAALASTT